MAMIFLQDNVLLTKPLLEHLKDRQIAHEVRRLLATQPDGARRS